MIVTEQCLETRIGAKRVEIRILRRPILVKSTMFHNPCKTVDGLFSASQKGIDASQIVKNRGLFGRRGEPI